MNNQLSPYKAILHPLWVLSLVVLVINDHALKGSGLLPGWLTGKLSDLAGFFLLPMLLAAVIRARGLAAVAACHGVAAVFLFLIELSPGFCALLQRALGFRLWPDPTDLLALASIVASWLVLVPVARSPVPVRRLAGRVLVLAGSVACVASTQTPGPGGGPASAADLEIFQRISFGETPGSHFWCGNLYKLPRPMSPQPDTQTETPNCAAACCGKASIDGQNIVAHEHAEIRGWIDQFDGPLLPDGEVHFTIYPDFGWLAATDAVEAISTLPQFMKLVTPMAEGGEGAVHVEMNYWEPARACGVQRGWCGLDCLDGKYETAVAKYLERGKFCDEYQSRRPADWRYPTSLPFTFAPFDPGDPPHDSTTAAGPFGHGDYVRMVGTLWEDSNHGGVECWTQVGSRTADRGWLEMHSVDFMARIAPPSGRSPAGQPGSLSELAVLSACTTGQTTSSVDIFPVRPKPAGHWRAHLAAEVVNPDFTNSWSIMSKTVTPRADAVNVTVQVAGRGINERGMFFASYTADWEACTPDCQNKQCGDYDGCDGTCNHDPECAGDSMGTCACQCPNATVCVQHHAECARIMGGTCN